MAAFRALIVLGLFVAISMGQQCDKAFDDFHQCLRDSFKPGQRQGQAQGRPNFEELKKKADECFTSNNCEAPQGGPRGGPGGSQSGPGGRGGRGENGNGPNGSRPGRQGNGQDGQGDNSDRRKCFQSVSNKTKDYLLQCIRKADPSFTLPEKGRGGRQGAGSHGGDEGHGFGGPGGPGFGGHGGPGFGGPGGPNGGPPGGQQFLLDACKNNADAANKVKACLAGVFPKPDTAQLRKDFEDHCKAKSDCEAKLGSCKDVMEKRRQAMCTCGNEVQSKRQEFLQQEPSCANQQSASGNNGPAPARQPRQRDCNEKPQDPCQQGFDAVMQQAQSRRKPNGN